MNRRDGEAGRKRVFSPYFIKVVLVVLPVLLLAVYYHTFDYPFYFDDKTNITANSSIRLDEFSLDGLKRAVSGSHSKNRPVANISFALNYLFGEYDPVFYRAVNILIHGLNGILLFFLIRSLLSLSPDTRSINNPSRLAYLTVLIWLVHPLHIQSVTYIVQRMNSMAAMFYLASMLFYIAARQTQQKSRMICYWCGCALSGFLALGSKEIAATLPFIICLFEWYFFRNLDKKWFKRNLLGFGVGFAAGLVLLFILTHFYLGVDPIEKVLASYAHRDFTLEQRLLTEMRVVVFYFFLFIWPLPSKLTLLHDFPLSNSLVDPIATLGSLAVLIIAFVFVVYLAKKHRLLSFCIAWFMANLVLESSIIGLEIIFEHRTYVPSMLLTLLFTYLVCMHVQPDWVKKILFISVLVCLSFWTFERNKVWANKVDFWLDCLEKCPNEIRIHNNLGRALEDQGNMEKAIAHYQKAIEHNNRFTDAYNNLALALEKVGQHEAAENVYRHVLSFDSRSGDTHYNLGRFLSQSGRHLEAIEFLEKSHDLQHPDSDPDVHNNLGIIMAMLGRLTEANVHFSEALRIYPDDIYALNNLGLTYARQGELDNAEKMFRRVLEIDPDFGNTRNFLEVVRNRQAAN